jgi:S1-C subfamily serine protease
MREGRVRRAYLGLAGGSRPLPPRLAAEIGRRAAVEVVEVVEGSPAAAAGLRAEDLIFALDGDAIASVEDVQRLMTADRIGDRVSASVFRQGTRLELTVVPEELQP